MPQYMELDAMLLVEINIKSLSVKCQDHLSHL
ncbi:hypothetical protein CsSME_00031690 [Camellia sinensis var. sinensis]